MYTYFLNFLYKIATQEKVRIPDSPNSDHSDYDFWM